MSMSMSLSGGKPLRKVMNMAELIRKSDAGLRVVHMGGGNFKQLKRADAVGASGRS